MADAARADLSGLQGVAELLQLEERLRRAGDRAELGNRLVHETTRLCLADIGVLWLDGPRQGRVEAVAHLPEPVRDSPFSQWVRALCAWRARRRDGGSEPETLNADSLPDRLRGGWREHMAANALWVPLMAPSGYRPGALVLARKLPWQPSEIRILARVGEAYAHSLEALRARGRRRIKVRRGLTRTLIVAGLVVIAAAMFVPVPLSVLAPAEVVPDAPFVVKAPLDGVIESVAVEANAEVAAGDVLLTLEQDDLRTQLDVARQALEIAQAEFRQAQQTAMRDREASSRIAVLSARVTQAGAEVVYLQGLLDRVSVRAERGGLAIMGDREALIGKPVRLGERLMTIADEGSVRVEAWLPVADAVPMDPGADARLYLNVSVERPLEARLSGIDYRAEVSPAGVLAFRVEARFVEGTGVPRIGQRGTLRLYGEEVPLYRYLFRRPIAAARPWLGL